MDGGSTDRKFVSWRERASIGNLEWTGNFGVRPGIREIGEEGIGRDGLRSWLREEGDRGCKPWADGGGREEGGGKFVDSGRSTQMGMGKIRTGRGGDERKWQGREELGEDEVVCRRGRQWRIPGIAVGETGGAGMRRRRWRFGGGWEDGRNVEMEGEVEMVEMAARRSGGGDGGPAAEAAAVA